MPDMLVRDVDPEALERLRARAKGNGRSLAAEVRRILEAASLQDAAATARERAEAMTARLRGRTHTDGVELLREDRRR